jgi:hypothetical protein
MNTLFNKTLILGLCSASFVAAQDRSEWTVTLVQKHLESSGVFQGRVDMKGNRVSFAPIPEGGSEFTLWAYRRGADGLEEHLVDTEVVGAYLPEGEIWITTGDPYTAGIPRTRIDQPFTVNYEVNGLMSDADAPEAAKRVLLDHKVTPATGDPKESNLGEEVAASQGYIDRNGVRSYKQFASPLIGADLFNSAGVETLRLFALPDGQVAELELSSAQVQIWPMSTGSFSGADPNTSYTIAPSITVDLVNLYPESETWVQYYPGPPVPGTVGNRLIEQPPVILQEADRPENRVLTFTQLDNVFDANGPWTLEVIHRTPFGIEVISDTTVNINRDLKLRGSFQALAD